MSKTLLVTGASRGIGYQTVIHLAKKGHTVIATARSQDKLENLKDAAKPGNVIPVVADLTNMEDIKKLTQAAEAASGIDGLINNAGAVHRQAFMETDLDAFKKLMDVNVYAIIRLIQALKPLLGKNSHILNISSMSGYQGSLKFAGLSAYGTAKAAVVGLSETLSAEFANDGIAVNCLCIGAVQTEMFSEAFPGLQAPVAPSQMGSYIADFILTGHQFYNGKVLPVALNNPE
jgi:NAD(P)-dependent dehydrogenase (short-subunit alcohol dehydrogenase family)